MFRYMKLYPALRPLTLVVKQLLALRCLNEVYTGGVGSYAILLMIMSFLQVSRSAGLWGGGRGGFHFVPVLKVCLHSILPAQ